jgi:NADPH-dependent 2,4-dienoyl-CoA reductase/sulfur reductase-like enzyme
VIEKRQDLLLTTPADFKSRYNVDVRTGTEVTVIDRGAKTVTVKILQTGKVYVEPYDKLILSPGAEPLKPPIPGIKAKNIFSLRNIPDTDRIKAYVDQHNPASAVVVGAGFIGLEMLENLTHRNLEVTVIEKLDQLLPPLDTEMAAFIQLHLQEKGIVCHLNDGVTTFVQNSDGLIVTTESNRQIITDMVILSIGVRPESRLAQEAGLSLGEYGGIRVNDAMQTSDADIFAVGDAVEVTDMITGTPALIPLAGPANKQGRIAADNALGRQSVFKGALGTAIVKVFDLTAAVTGAAEKKLARQNIPYLAKLFFS